MKKRYLIIFSFVLLFLLFSNVSAIRTGLPTDMPLDGTGGSYPYDYIPPTSDVNSSVYQGEYQEMKCKGTCKVSCDSTYEEEIVSEFSCEDNEKCCQNRCFKAGGTCEVNCGDKESISEKCENGKVCCGLTIAKATAKEKAKLMFLPEVGIPGFNGAEINGDLLKTFLLALYNYLLYLSGIFAVIMIIVAGFQWVMAGGNQSKIGTAKERIKNAITGLVLISCSYLILSIINTDLINIKSLNVKTIVPTMGGFSETDYQKVRTYALANPVKCTSNSSCRRGEVCIAKNPSNPKVDKICMNPSKDGDQCDEQADCLQGLFCRADKCVVPSILRCIGQKDLGGRCFKSLYPVEAGFCLAKNTCTTCIASGQNCSFGTGIDLLLTNDTTCKGQNNLCGQINDLAYNEDFRNLPEYYQQKSSGNCKKQVYGWFPFQTYSLSCE